MRTLLQLAAVLALLAFSVGAAVFVYDSHKLSGDAHVLILDADAATKHLLTSLAALDQVSLKSAGLLDESQATAKNIETASAAEAAYWNATAKQTSLAARDMRALIARTDRELNDKFLPDLDAQLAATSTAAQFSFESITKASDALTFQINDPVIPQTLEAFNAAAHNLSLAAGNGNSILAHGDHVAAYYDKKLTTPLGFWKTFLKTSLSIGSQAGNISAGFVK
jgi:hypothetical protein